MTRQQLARVSLVPALATLGFGALWAGSVDRELLVISCVLIGVVVSFAAEHVAPFERVWNDDRGDRRRDLAHALVNEGMIVSSMFVLAATGGTISPVSWWPDRLPFGVQVAGAVVVADLGITLMHWWSHRIDMLWRFHAVHHSARRMYGFNGLMKHPLHQIVETVAGVGPLIVVGIPDVALSVVAALVVLQLLIQHSNVDYPTRWLDTFWVTNRAHRVHHLNRLPEGDSNFGLFLTVWDRVLGTLAVSPKFGIRDGDLGLAGRADYPIGYLDQLREPLRRRQSTNTATGR